MAEPEAPTGAAAAGRVVAHRRRPRARAGSRPRAPWLAAGARVIAVGRDAGKLDGPRRELPASGSTEECDLTDEPAVQDLAERVHDRIAPVDGILHLVGGWRGGGGLAGQTEEDYRVLEASLHGAAARRAARSTPTCAPRPPAAWRSSRRPRSRARSPAARTTPRSRPRARRGRVPSRRDSPRTPGMPEPTCRLRRWCSA